jgi:1-acyl-sn-glycerol-3-phosphate acyltransferase
MKDVSRLFKVFIDFVLVPIIVCFLLIVIVVASIKYKNSFPTAVKITEYIVWAVIVMLLCYWARKIIYIPVPRGMKLFAKTILTSAYATLAFVVYWGVGVIGLAIFSIWKGAFYFVTYYLAATITFASGAIPHKIGNFEKIGDGKPKIIIMNHASFIDYILTVCAMAFRQKWKVVIGANLNKYWPFNKYIKHVGIFLKRTEDGKANEGSDSVVLKQMIQALDEGYNVVVFAGGGRDRPGKIRDFEIGAFKLALKKKIPIIPIALHDTGKYCPAGPQSKNMTGEVPKKFWPLLAYRIQSLIDVIGLFLEGKVDHMLISPRLLKIEVLPEVSRFHYNGTQKTPEELSEETHTIIHTTLGNVN